MFTHSPTDFINAILALAATAITWYINLVQAFFTTGADFALLAGTLVFIHVTITLVLITVTDLVTHPLTALGVIDSDTPPSLSESLPTDATWERKVRDSDTSADTDTHTEIHGIQTDE